MHALLKKLHLCAALAFLVSSAATAQPHIASFFPIKDNIGSNITISGANFNSTPGLNVVFFGATRASVTAASSTSLTVAVPLGATCAPITVLDVTTGLSAYSPLNFTPTFPSIKTDISTADFDAGRSFFTSNGPTSVNIGDIDGDGKPDLVLSTSINNVVSVLRNTSTSGNLSFASKVDFPTGKTPMYVTIGDIDGDGKPDLAVANMNDNTVSVLRNTSSPGSLSFANRIDFTSGETPYAVAIGDIDGDGKPDLAIANDGSWTISILRNTGASGRISFADKTDYRCGVFPGSIVIGDIDGDGKPDIATANYDRKGLSVFRNIGSTGNISFDAKIDFTTGTGDASRSLVMTDIDGDGKLDLATANSYDNSISIMRNTSSAGTIQLAKSDYPVLTFPYSIAAGDLDGDGKPDLATANWLTNSYLTRVSVVHNTSSPGTSSFGSNVALTSERGPFGVAVGDLDGDGKPDIAIANNTVGTVTVLRNNPSLSSPIQATNITFINTTATGTTINWTNGNGTARAVFIKMANTGFPSPVDGATYTPNTVFGAGTQIGTSGWYNIYNGTGTSVTVSGLANNTTYQVMVNEYHVAIGQNVYITTPAAGNPAPVTTLSSNADLLSLTLSAGILTPVFAPGTTIYTTDVSNFTNSITLKPITSDNAATVKINGFAVTSGTASNAIALNVGSNIITTTITAQDGTTKTYTVTVNRAGRSIATLSNLTVSTGLLVPAFASTTTAYAVAVSNATTDIKLTPTATDATATITVNGSTVASGSASGSISLNVGPNTITTVVTAQNGTTKTYIVIVTRAAVSVAILTNLTPSTGTLTPAFTSGNTAYTINLSNVVSNIALTPTISNGVATIKINGAIVANGEPGNVIPLVAGANTLTVTLNAPDGTIISTYTVVVNREKATQSITFTAFSPKVICDADFRAGAISTNASIPITYSSSNSAVATISGLGIIHLTGAGSTTISAYQNGNNDYLAATDVSQVLIVTGVAVPIVTIIPDHNSVCAGSPVTFTASASNINTNLSFQWQVNGLNTGSNTPTFTIIPTSSTDIFQCLVTNHASCGSVGSSNKYSGITIIPAVIPLISISSSANSPVCSGQAITFTVSSINAGANPTYQWQVNGNNTGNNTPQFTSNSLLNNDLVTCVLTNNDGACVLPASVTSNTIAAAILTNTGPAPSVTIKYTIVAGSTFMFTAVPQNAGNNISYQWKVNGLDVGQDNYTYTSNSLITNDVVECVIISGIACAAPASSNLVVINLTVRIPTAFTPNGDGVNDYWKIDDLVNYPDSFLKIFNRTGSLVFQARGYFDGWDGTIDGKPLPTGVYYYVIDLGTNSKVLSGNITIIR